MFSSLLEDSTVIPIADFAFLLRVLTLELGEIFVGEFAQLSTTLGNLFDARGVISAVRCGGTV